MDGPVRVYHGEQTKLPRHYVARQRLYLRATVDYWINALDGQPFFYVNKEVDPGLVQTLREDLALWLQANAPVSEEHRRRMQEEVRLPLFTVIFDREGYSPDLFQELWAERIAVLTYRKYAEEDWPREEFQKQKVKLVAGLEVDMTLAGAGGAQDRRRRPPDLDREHLFCGGGGVAGGGSAGPLVSGELLPLHAPTLWSGCTCAVWDGADS